MCLSISATGSMKEEISPGDLVVVDQFIDLTKRRAVHVLRRGRIAAHVAFADPVCPIMRRCAARGCRGRRWVRCPTRALVPDLHDGGTYVCIEGPQFSTRAESLVYRSWGVDLDRHDQHARGQARARGAAALCHARPRHRLRLLARRPKKRSTSRLGHRAPSHDGRTRSTSGAAPRQRVARRVGEPGSSSALDGAIMTDRRGDSRRRSKPSSAGSSERASASTREALLPESSALEKDHVHTQRKHRHRRLDGL